MREDLHFCKEDVLNLMFCNFLTVLYELRRVEVDKTDFNGDFKHKA